MYHRLAILFICITYQCGLYAQQPPQQLPSLLEDSYTMAPGINDKESPEATIRKSIFVKAFINEKAVYAGEPVTATYKLYSCIFCRSRINKQPSFYGCSVTELPYSNDPEIEIIKGIVFHVYTIRKVQLIPLKEGALQLGQAEIENMVPFSRPGEAPDNFSLMTTNTPLFLQVKPLPQENKPADFTGVVGSFSIEAAVDSNTIPVGENATLNVTIKGAGNFTGIHLPKIDWPRGTEHFEASDTQHIDQDEHTITGYKKFSIPFIGSEQGDTVIGPVSFNFYDPFVKAYKTIAVEKVAVTFTKAITKEEELATIVQEDVGNSKYLWIVGAIAATVTLVWLVRLQVKTKNTQRPVQEKIVNEKPAIVIPEADHGAEILSALNRLGDVDDDKKFLSAASHLLATSLQLKLSVPEGRPEQLLYVLQQRSFDSDIITMCSRIFKECNRNLYSPDIQEGIKEQVYFELSAVIKKLYALA